jgi:hypothetical protein
MLGSGARLVPPPQLCAGRERRRGLSLVPALCNPRVVAPGLAGGGQEEHARRWELLLPIYPASRGPVAPGDHGAERIAGAHPKGRETVLRNEQWEGRHGCDMFQSQHTQVLSIASGKTAWV